MVPELRRVPLTLGPKGEIQHIGEYRVLGVLGRGGMGIVYEVQHETSTTIHALKTIETLMLHSGGDNVRTRFGAEIRVLQQLSHRNIVRIEDAAIAEHPQGYDLLFMVTERLAGEPLSDKTKRDQQWAMRDTLPIIRDVSDALVYLDAQGVQHRDIKPSNLFCTEDGRTVLIDFGLARREDQTHLTSAGQIIGSRAYMAPERFLGQPTGISTDVFSLGVVMYRLLTGKPPYEGQTPTEMVIAIRAGLKAEQQMKIVSRTAGRLIEEMLAPKPEDRPKPSALLGRIDGLIAGFTETAAHAQEALEPEPVATSREPSSLAAPEDSRPLRGPAPSVPRTMAIGMAIATFIGGFMGGFISSRIDATPPQPQPEPEVVMMAPPPKPEPARPVVTRSAPEPVPPPPVAPPPPPPAQPTFSSADAAYSYGRYALLEKRYPDAVVALERAVTLNPAMAEATRALGDAYRGVGQSAKAKKAYRTYLALRPRAVDADEVRARLR